jgi:hypothetical protein
MRKLSRGNHVAKENVDGTIALAHTMLFTHINRRLDEKLHSRDAVMHDAQVGNTLLECSVQILGAT